MMKLLKIRSGTNFEEHALKIYSEIIDDQGVFCTDNITLTPADVLVDSSG